MALFSFECDQCGDEFDSFASWSDAKAGVRCKCGGTGHKLISRVKLIGPTSTKPEIVDGKPLETASAVRAWERDNPGIVTVSKHDSRVRKQIDRIKQDRETKAIAAGFKSERHRIREAKREAKMEIKP